MLPEFGPSFEVPQLSQSAFVLRDLTRLNDLLRSLAIPSLGPRFSSSKRPGRHRGGGEVATGVLAENLDVLAGSDNRRDLRQGDVVALFGVVQLAILPSDAPHSAAECHGKAFQRKGSPRTRASEWAVC